MTKDGKADRGFLIRGFEDEDGLFSVAMEFDASYDARLAPDDMPVVHQMGLAIMKLVQHYMEEALELDEAGEAGETGDRDIHGRRLH